MGYKSTSQWSLWLSFCAALHGCQSIDAEQTYYARIELMSTKPHGHVAVVRVLTQACHLSHCHAAAGDIVVQLTSSSSGISTLLQNMPSCLAPL